MGASFALPYTARSRRSPFISCRCVLYRLYSLSLPAVIITPFDYGLHMPIPLVSSIPLASQDNPKNMSSLSCPVCQIFLRVLSIALAERQPTGTAVFGVVRQCETFGKRRHTNDWPPPNHAPLALDHPPHHRCTIRVRLTTCCLQTFIGCCRASLIIPSNTRTS
ncbi:hypothetical protein BGY98DRAFT_695268 [Russula aff. rugulosa BPL654]|nr:hypothetical protein BGY98DRAFT_695268 [Russula aff. rugulosa BPL654]